MGLQTAEWAFIISLVSLAVTAIANVMRASESRSTRRISIFTSTVDKYVGQIADALQVAEKAAEDLPAASDPTSKAKRAELYDVVNRSRRTTGRYLNVIIAAKAFDSARWKDFDEPFDMVMLHAVLVRTSVDEVAVAASIGEMIEALASLRAKAFQLRDDMMLTLLTEK